MGEGAFARRDRSRDECRLIDRVLLALLTKKSRFFWFLDYLFYFVACNILLPNDVLKLFTNVHEIKILNVYYTFNTSERTYQ